MGGARGAGDDGGGVEIEVSALNPTSLPGIAVQPQRSTAAALKEERAARPWLCVALLASADLIALTIAAAGSVLLWRRFTELLSPDFYLRLWPVLLLFPAVYAASGLYPGFGRSPVDELRKLSRVTSVVYAALAVTVFLLKDAPAYSRAVFLLAWAQTLVMVPLARAMLRSACSRRQWWGYPAVVVGAPKTAAHIAGTLMAQPELGLRPVAIFDDVEQAAPLVKRGALRHVILGMAEMPREAALDCFRLSSELFTNIIVVPDLPGLASLWVETRDLSGILGLEAHQRLLLPGSRRIKRALDLVLVALAGAVALPFAAAIAAVIKLTSPGPVFYGQQRYGRDGRAFTAWKFRSMVADASQALERLLASDSELRREWLRDQKLRNDPRITPIGRFLRRTSLDELPQVWNVLMGEMSLVGPRPIVAKEIPRYGDDFALYTRVTPGLTGLWQVSGRNLLSYEQRIGFDLYYVRNWSIWLDLHILARTVRTVLTGDGAY